MRLKVLGTGSGGNAYLLQAGGQNGQALLLDAGLPERELVRKGGRIESIVGCLITHEHGDHAKSAEAIARYGIKTYCTAGTAEALSKDGRISLLNTPETLRPFAIGDFTAMAFETQHDAAEPCGWLIRYEPTGETALYATDTYYLKYTFPGINYWIVECNYVESILAEQGEEGGLAAALRGRLIKSHMSLRRLCQAIEANDMTEARAIILVHMSDSRSDERMMVDAVKQVSGVEDVYAAKEGYTYELALTPF